MELLVREVQRSTWQSWLAADAPTSIRKIGERDSVQRFTNDQKCYNSAADFHDIIQSPSAKYNK